MAITIKFDLHDSTQTKGVTTRRYDKAMRRFRATGATNNDQILDEVIDEAIRQAGPFHQAATGTVKHDAGFGVTTKDLPLQRVYAKRFGNKVVGRLIYGFDQWSLPQGPNPIETANFDATYEPVASYRYAHDRTTGDPKFSDTTGLPDGDIYVHESLDLTNQKEGKPETSWIYKRPAIRLEVSAVLGFNPIGVVFPLQRHVNSGPVSFGGFEFAPLTIRFDHVQVRWSSSTFGDRFRVGYVFTIVQRGHWQHFVAWDADAKPPTWDIVEAVPYARASFVGAFPV